MIADMRDHPFYKNAEERTAAWLRPGSGEAAAIAQVQAAPDGLHAVGAALICDALEGVPSSRIALIDLSSGDLTLLTHGPRSDSSPRWSPDGRLIAYLSDREQAHANRLRILDLGCGEDRTTPEIPGFVEALEWSADGRAILLSGAEYGSDLAGSQGAFAVEGGSSEPERADWLPQVLGNPAVAPWRSLWLFDLASNSVERVTHAGVHVWHAVWCGEGQVAAICSDRPGESWWYSADVRLIDLRSGAMRALFSPQDQLGGLAASPSGSTVSVIEAVCSDRDVVAGNLRLINVATGAVDGPEALGGDVVQTHWRGDAHLLFSAMQGLDTVLGMLDTEAGTSRELWRSGESSLAGAIYPEVTPLGPCATDCLFVEEGFFDPPCLKVLEGGTLRAVREFGSAEVHADVSGLGSARAFGWVAPDGLEIGGWLITPPGSGPHPLIMQIHGGPVWCHRPTYLARSAFAQMALAAGYALFQPNPRGSSGRGQSFARRVFGDMGGADTHDCLSGLDALAAAGIVDPLRIGVTGGSYGGYMSNWLITQDDRFAAAVPVAPISNWISQHFTCNIGQSDDIFFGDAVSDPAGKYFSRSPVHHAAGARTPTLQICGALDRITPPGQAIEFHHGLQAAGVESLVATYPLEGHGIRTMPASLDYAARMLFWFTRHMPADPELSSYGFAGSAPVR